MNSPPRKGSRLFVPDQVSDTKEQLHGAIRHRTKEPLSSMALGKAAKQPSDKAQISVRFFKDSKSLTPHNIQLTAVLAKDPGEAKTKSPTVTCHIASSMQP